VERLSGCTLNSEEVMDCKRWRKQIGLTDDHDRCEWVNVSSGTAHPVCPTYYSSLDFGW